MIKKMAIKEVAACSDQFLSPVLLVPKKDGGQRPVINLKKLNQYVEYQHFKMEGIHQASEAGIYFPQKNRSETCRLLRRHDTAESMLIRDLSSLKWLLENLGFLIIWKKSVCVPTQVIQFLGFLIDSVEMVIRLPQEKIQKIIQKCQRLVSSKVTRVRKISEVLGLMTSSLQAIAPAPLHYRHL